jgi:hypothetical protein
MTLHVKRSTGWTAVTGFFVKRSTGWVQVPKAFVKKSTGWFQFWPQAGPSIDSPLTISRSSTTWPSTLTGTNYHWDNADTFTYKFQWSLTDSTNDADWTDLASYATITNPAIGSSNTKTYSITSANFSSTVRSKWFRFVVKAVDTTNNITKIEYSNNVNISKTDLTGTAGTVVIARQSSTSYIYSVTNNGTWSSTPASYRYQWQYNLSGTWTNISGATSISVDLSSSTYLNQQIRCQVWATDDVGAESAEPIISNTLTVTATPPGIQSFSVTGGALKVIYSFVVTSSLPANQILMSIKLERLNFGTWSVTDTFEVGNKTPSNVIYDVTNSGTYRATLTVNDTINPIQTSVTPEFQVTTISKSNVALAITSTGFTAPSNINFTNLWVVGQSVQTGAIGWTNGANMNSTDVYWSGNYSGNDLNRAVSGQGQYSTFNLNETTGNASITATITQTGYGQATLSWNQVGAQSYRAVYRVTPTNTSGFTDYTVTGNNSGSSVSVILNATLAKITLLALYVYEFQNQTGRMVPNVEGTETYVPAREVTLGIGTQLTTTASGTITMVTAPGVPTSLTKVSEDNGKITFSWGAPTSNGGSTVTRYDVMVYQNGAGSFISNGLSTTYTATFTTGNTGIFYVRAVNAWSAGTSASSGTLYIPQISTGPVTSNSTATTTRANWTSYNQSAYTLSVAGDSSAPYTGTSAIFKDISNLAPGTQYPFALAISSVTGNTASQNVYNTITSAYTTGSVVNYTTNNQLRAGQRVRITGIIPSAFNITGIIASAGNSYFTINTYVDPANTYSSGGTASAIINTYAADPTVTISNIVNGGFTANWSATGATQYYVNIYKTSDSTSISGYPKYTTLTTSGALTGLATNTSYTVSVASVNQIGSFSNTITTSATTGAIPAGGSIQWSASNPAIGNTITIGTLNWSPTPTSYDLRIVRGTQGVVRQETTVASTTTSGPLSYVVQSADAGYYFKGFVQASNGFGSSDWINTTEIGPVPAPALYTVTFSGNGQTYGTPSVSSVTQSSSGASVTLATVGSMGKPPYVFGGWTIGGVSYPSGGTYTPTANVTASAIWNSSTPSAPGTPSITLTYSSGPTWNGSWTATGATSYTYSFSTANDSSGTGAVVRQTGSGTSMSYTGGTQLWGRLTITAINSGGSTSASSAWT